MKYLLFLVLLAAFALPSYAQEPTKVDEFGSPGCEDYLARMDNYIVQSNNYPTAKIYVFVYEGKTISYKYVRDGKATKISSLPQSGLADAKIRSMKKYLKKFKRANDDSFTFIKAGFREDFGIEVWLVPAGATPPKPTPTLAKMKYRKGKPYGFCTGCCE